MSLSVPACLFLGGIWLVCDTPRLQSRRRCPSLFSVRVSASIQSQPSARLTRTAQRTLLI